MNTNTNTNNAPTNDTGAVQVQVDTTQAMQDRMTVHEVDGTTRVEIASGNISLDTDPTATKTEQTIENANTHGADGTKEGNGEAGNGGESQQQQSSNAETQVQQDLDKQKQTEQEVKADLAKKNVDFDALAKEYADAGELSADSLKKLADAGYPKQVVDAYLDGLNARMDRFVSTVKGYAGGEEEFAKLQTYIAGQPQEVIDGFNSAVNSGNLGQIKLAIAGLKAEMTKAYGTANPTVMAGQAKGGGEPQGYTNFEQMTKDMSDPRYNVDPIYTRQVYAKVKAATIF